MKLFIEIQESSWLPGNKEMIYKDTLGDTFIGAPITYTQGETTVIEASELPEDGHYYIIKVIGHIPKKQK